MNNIKEKRLSVGLSREEFAKRLGLSYITLARYENGDREPRVSDLMKMADVLGCTMDALFSNHAHNARLNDCGVKGEQCRILAAVALAELSPGDIVRASIDLCDGRADTECGVRLLELMRTVGGAALV